MAVNASTAKDELTLVSRQCGYGRFATVYIQTQTCPDSTKMLETDDRETNMFPIHMLLKQLTHFFNPNKCEIPLYDTSNKNQGPLLIFLLWFLKHT